MSLNSSSSNASLHHPSPSSSFFELLHKCLISAVGVVNVTAFIIISIFLIVPLCIYVLYLGHQRWRKQRSGTTMSHSDLFTYHMVISELLSVFGCILGCVGVHLDFTVMVMPCVYLFSSNFFVQMFFHTLTCVERYLAVSHPVTYLGLKKANWIRFRNITIACVWLLCIALTGLMTVTNQEFIAFDLCFVLAVIIVICFCSVSVLCTLIRPGPGEVGGDRQHIGQSKLRAYYTIMAILGALVLRFGADILSTALYQLLQLEEAEQCGLLFSDVWFSLPSSLVLPLLFLHRAGKLPCCKKNNQAGQ